MRTMAFVVCWNNVVTLHISRWLIIIKDDTKYTHSLSKRRFHFWFRSPSSHSWEIATSEHSLNSAYNRHESRARRSPLGWHWTADIANMGNGYEKKWKYVLAAPKRISLWHVEKRNATVFGTMARNQATRGVATVLLIQNRASVGLVPHGSEILL